MGENVVQMDLFGAGCGVQGAGCVVPGAWCDNNQAPSTLHPAPIPPPLSVEPEPDMVRVAPGRHGWVPKSAATPPPEYVMCRWSRQQDGTYAPVPVAGRYVRLDSKTATLLGFPLRAGNGGMAAAEQDRKSERCRYDTILRLGRAGFVDVVRIAPNTILLDLDSWYRHLADCMNDPERWDEGKEDREIYLRENDLGGWKRFV